MLKTKSCGVIVVLALSALLGTGIVLAADGTIEISIAPSTLNLYDIEDKCVTVHAEIPYSEVASEPISSLTLATETDSVSAYLAFWDSRGDLVVKFDREEVGNIVDVGDVTLKLTGYKTDGTEFTGTDTIRVINSGKTLP